MKVNFKRSFISLLNFLLKYLRNKVGILDVQVFQVRIRSQSLNHQTFMTMMSMLVFIIYSKIITHIAFFISWTTLKFTEVEHSFLMYKFS